MPTLLEVIEEVFTSQPFRTVFHFSGKLGEDVAVSDFKDPNGNNIDIYFYHDGNSIYSLDFSVNGDSYRAKDNNYSVRDYTTLLSTVAEATSQFLQKFHPLGLQIKGTNVVSKLISRPSTEGQKDRIYNFFVAQIEDKGNYMVDKSVKDGIALMRK